MDTRTAKGNVSFGGGGIMTVGVDATTVTSIATDEFQVEIDTSPIFQVVSFVEQRLIEQLHKHPDALKVINWRRFEEIVAELWDGFGYETELTKRTRDGGIDVIAIKRCEVDVRYLISCKRPDPGNPVRLGAVRELHSVKISEGATKGILATTTHFTRDAKLFVEKHPWELDLRDFEAIKEWVAQYLRLKGKLALMPDKVQGK